MALTSVQQEIWEKIANEYRHWDEHQNQLMPVSELASRLDDVAPNAIGAVLAEASANNLAEVDSLAESPSFRLLPRH
jgi:hypothetical protein